MSVSDVKTEKQMEIDAWVLPTPQGYVLHTKENLDQICKRFEQELYTRSKEPVGLQINIYSPKRLHPWDLAFVENAIHDMFSGYLGAIKSFRCRVNKWLKKVAAPIEATLFGSMVTANFLRPIYLPTLPWFLAATDIFFWGCFIFLPSTIIPGFLSLRYWRRARRVERFADCLRHIHFVQGGSEKETELVNKAREHFLESYDETKSTLDIYREMDSYLKGEGYDTQFYAQRIKELESSESFFTQYRPVSWRRRIKNALKVFYIPAKPIQVALGKLGDNL
jgi:hypothetical protein